MFQFDARLRGDGGITVSGIAQFRGAHAPRVQFLAAPPKTIPLAIAWSALGEGAKRCTRGRVRSPDLLAPAQR